MPQTDQPIRSNEERPLVAQVPSLNWKSQIDDIISKMEARIKHLSLFNGLLLVSIVAVVAGSAFMTWSLIEITMGSLQTANETTERFQEATLRAEAALAGSNKSILALKNEIDNKYLISHVKGEFDTYAKQVQGLKEEIDKKSDQTATDKKTLKSAEEIQKTLTRFHDNVNGLRMTAVLDTLNASQLATEKLAVSVKNASRPHTITLAVINMAVRAGVLIVALYLAQVLLGIYKYNTQLADHYTTRTEAIRLCLAQEGRFELATMDGVTKILSTASLNFGNPEATPARELAELVKTVADLQKGKTQ